MKTPDYEFSGQHRKLTYDCKAKPETKRVYIFPGGDRIEVEGVVVARASRHGNHSLTLVDGTVTVVSWGWLTLTFPAESSVTPKEVAERGETAWSEQFTAGGYAALITANKPSPSVFHDLSDRDPAN